MASTSKKTVTPPTPAEEHCRALGNAVLAIYETLGALLTAPKDQPLLDGDGKKVTRANLDKTCRELAESIAHIQRDIKRMSRKNRQTKQTSRVALVNDPIYSIMDSGCKKLYGVSLRELNGRLVNGADEINVVETSRQAPRILASLFKPFARELVIGGKKSTKYVVTEKFRKMLDTDHSAALILDGEQVDESRGGEHHSAKDVEALTTYKGVRRSTIYDFLNTPHQNEHNKTVQVFTEYTDDQGDTYVTFTPTTMVRSIVALCTVPDSFRTEAEQSVIQAFKAVDAMENEDFNTHFGKVVKTAE